MSRFTSGGTDQEPTERDDAWIQAQQAVEARHIQKLEAGRQEGGKSLFETLQANKEAKQQAFEESIRLSNQFRNLDEDEIDFLDSVTAESRAKEAEIQREAAAQLESFRTLQEEAERASKQSAVLVEPVVTEAWSAGPRKRKKQKELAGIVKKRQLSSATKMPNMSSPVANDSQNPHMRDAIEGQLTNVVNDKLNVHSRSEEILTTNRTDPDRTNPDSATAPKSITSKPLLGLADYSSDDD